MEKRPEDEPVPIKLQNQELELAWYGLLYSIKSGFISRGDAIKTLQDWDGQTLPEAPSQTDETDIIGIDE
jgi:hypothetical protein